MGKLINKTHISLIHEGVNIATKEHVAIKFEKIGDKYDFLQSETFILLLLKGIGIPRVISYGKVMNYKVLVEELLGKSVYMVWDKLIHTDETINDVCLIALQSLDRLEYIHTKNIIHKDIKPSNILISLNKTKVNEICFKISDLGLNRILVKKETITSFSNKKSEIFSPEFLKEETNLISSKTDIWSLGILIYYLLNKEYPYSGTEYEIVNQIE